MGFELTCTACHVEPLVPCNQFLSHILFLYVGFPVWLNLDPPYLAPF